MATAQGLGTAVVEAAVVNTAVTSNASVPEAPATTATSLGKCAEFISTKKT